MQIKYTVLVLFFFIFLQLTGEICYAGDLKITGTIKDNQGHALSGASVIFTDGTTNYKTTSAGDGTYLITVPYTGIEETESDIRLYSNFPNPFSDKTVVPVYLKKPGNLIFTVYNLVGQKVWETAYSPLCRRDDVFVDG